ncbi:MAG TPA: lysophospholipid acyltransferase family protein [Candidatus Acidoferrales bacterium]|nr:lysophospholipid acyltransferase family protein [Candidatus Acidoferrales bacterium]
MNFSDYLQLLLLRVIGAFLRRFSLKSVHKMAASLGSFFYRHIPIRENVALTNLKLCFPEKGNDEIESILEKSYVNITTVFFEFLYFPEFTKDSLRNVVEFPDESRRLIESALERGRGLILMSGHFSNWELVALAIGAFSPKHFSVVVHPFHNKSVDKFANKYRELLGNSTVPMENSVRASLSTLRENGIVALLADQSAAKESTQAKFFGIDVPTFQGPALFALRTRAAVQFGVLVRKNDGTYRLHLHEIDYSDLPDDSEASVAELTQRHVTALEGFIRECPENWLWFHKRFKHVQIFQEKLREIEET